MGSAILMIIKRKNAAIYEISIGHSLTKRKRDKRKRTGDIKISVIKTRMPIKTLPSSGINHERMARAAIAKYTSPRKRFTVCAKI